MSLYLLKSIIWFIGLFLLMCGIVYLLQDKMLFFPPSFDYTIQQGMARHYPQSEVEFITPDGNHLRGWLLKSKIVENQRLIIYFGGNAEEVSGMTDFYRQFPDWSLLLVNYRGYGASTGKPSQTALCSDALTVFDKMTPTLAPKTIVVMGWSLGTGVAVYLAAHRPVQGVILVTPFDSLAQVAQHHYPYLPVNLLFKHPFNVITLAPSIKVPLLALIAQQDTVIPPIHADRLVKQWGGPSTVQRIENVDHNTISGSEIYWKMIKEFLNNLSST